jgi:DNA primase
MTIIDEIKAKARIEDVISADGVKLKKSGAAFTGFCPFHENKRTPSFVVYPNDGNDGIWKCFGDCNESGDVISYVMKRNPGWDIIEAMKYLCEKYGIEYKQGKTDLGGRIASATAADVRRVAMGVFRKWLVGEVDRKTKKVLREGDKAALAYALDRGWTVETLKFEGIGFSGNNTDAEKQEMRDEFRMYGIDPLDPTAVMILGFKGDAKKWATEQNLDPSDFDEHYIMGFMETPGLMYAHKFDGVIEYLSCRFLPEWEQKRGRKSHNPPSALAGVRRAYRNSLYRHCHSADDEKGALLYVVEGQGDGVTNRQFGVPSTALCGSQWNNLVENGEVRDWLNDYDEIIYVTDADKAGEQVVTGTKNDFAMASALGAMLWVGRTPKVEWARPDGAQKTIKDVNDIAQNLKDTKADEKKGFGLFNEIAAKAERIVVLAARYAGTLEGHGKEQMVDKIVKPMILSIPEDRRVILARDLALALYPKLAKSEATTAFNKWLNMQVKTAAKAEKEKKDDHIPEAETLGGYFRNPEDPTQGWLVDMIYDTNSQKAMLAYRNPAGEIGVSKSLEIYGKRYFPSVDDFVRKGVVVFPSALGELKTTSELLRIHEEHDRVSVLFDKSTDYAMAAYYQVFTWVFDCFNELPFLRARGGKDTGKSAIMLRIGYLCYRMAKSTGIGTTASLKYAQERFNCTVYFDEMDIADKFDERIVMLNVRAMKDQAFVWSMKAATGPDGEQVYVNQAHNVYGPALITMYGAFSDEATDSRCITFDLFGKDVAELRARGIPRRLSAEWHARALEIRNMSLHWRLKNWKPDLVIPDELEDDMVSTRANQVTVPIKYIVKDDAAALAEITATVREMYADEILEKAQSFEARFLEAIIALTESQKFAILDFVHEAELKEYGHAKYIRYPDLAKVVNFLLDAMNTGIEKDVESIVRMTAPEQAPEEKEKKDEKEKGKKKRKPEEAGVSAKTVGNVVRKQLRLPVDRHGAGYVVIVWSQSKPDEVQMRIEKLRKQFGLDLLRELDTPGIKEATVEEPEEPNVAQQMEMYAEMADEED